jgi:hypothetical protein
MHTSEAELKLPLDLAARESATALVGRERDTLAPLPIHVVEERTVAQQRPRDQITSRRCHHPVMMPGGLPPATLALVARHHNRNTMSTKATLAHHDPGNGEPSWHLYEEVFEAGVVYLELRGVSVELHTREQGGADVVLRLPIETAEQLGLNTNVPAERWKSACDENKTAPLRRLQGSVRRFDDPTDPL